jgi:diaminohydroxyphosphoribosylaminopyrimidine deaminase/5-amino-6-(5-phosphoribosylamino)uracil reductase
MRGRSTLVAMSGSSTSIDHEMLRRAVLAGLRGRGNVEPNPCVGCVIGREANGAVTVLTIGHHRHFGAAHAEVEALAECTQRGIDPRGATAWVTLEPCNHHGKTGPCTEALLAAGIARVVCARRDPNPVAAGGAEHLRAAGVRVDFIDDCEAALHLAEPWATRLATGLPWVIVKWAQTSDGYLALREGEPRWISSPASRRMVHRVRGRVDAILTGIGTVLADDPLLTVRGVTARRTPRRVVMDSRLRMPVDCRLVRSAGESPVLIATSDASLIERADHAAALRAAGVEVIGLPEEHGRVPIALVLRHLSVAHGAASVLVEAGPALISAVINADLADEMLVFVGPGPLGGGLGARPAHIGDALDTASARGFVLKRSRMLAGDRVMSYARG